MKKKLLGIFVCMLLIATAVLPVTGNIKMNYNLDSKVIKNIGESRTLSINLPEEEWNVTFGGLLSDTGYCVQQTSDGGYVLAGKTYSYGSACCAWVVKTDEKGVEIWNTTICADNYIVLYYIYQTSDGGYLLTGRNSIGGLHGNFWICYLNSNGNVMYQKSYGDTWSEEGWCGKEASDGEYIFTGLDRGPGDDHDVWLIKTYTDGSINWSKIFGHGSYNEVGRSVDETVDGGFIISGFSGNNPNPDGKYDFWLIKTDSSGNKQWDRLFGGLGAQRSYCVEQTDDNGFIQCGWTEDDYGFGDIWLLKTNDTGIHEWNRTFGGSGDDQGWCVQQTNDSGFILTGYTNSTGAGDYDVWLIKTDNFGVMEWNLTFGGEDPDYGRSVRVTNDGGYIIGGNTNSSGEGVHDFWLIKIAPETGNKPPEIQIINPKEGYFHFSGIPLFPTFLDLIADTMSIGGFRLRPIIINATDDIDDSENLIVKVYLNEEEKGNASYCKERDVHSWKWTGWALGTYNLTITAEDSVGAIGSAHMDVWNFCFIP